MLILADETRGSRMILKNEHQKQPIILKGGGENGWFIVRKGDVLE